MLKVLFAALLSLSVALSAAPGSAMVLKISTLSSGQKIVKASGDIVPGDARKLEKALSLATRDKQGTIQMRLNSDGGVVAEAFRMAEIMDRVGVSTVVGKGDLCASACAQVLFVSGKYRSVQKGGSLVIHSCYNALDGRAVEYCNAVISKHAQDEGVDGAAMMAFQQAAGTDSAILFDNESAACFGLTRAPGKKTAAPCLAELKRRAKAR
jgi:hypothetical protein